MRALIDVTISALYLLEENDSRCRNSWRNIVAAEGCKYPVHTHAFAYFIETIKPGASSHLASCHITPVQLPKWGSLIIHGTQPNDSFMTLQQNQLIIQQYGNKTKLQYYQNTIKFE